MQDVEKIILVHTTFPNLETAETISETLIKEKLVACAHLHSPVQALYEWEGTLQKEQEIPVTYKLPLRKEKTFRESFLSLHPYDIPEYLCSTISTSQAYGKWVADITGN